MAFIFCIGMLMGMGCVSEKNSAKSEIQKLQGTWQLVYQQMDGKKLPDQKAAEMVLDQSGQAIFVILDH